VAKEKTSAFPNLDYSILNIYTEEAKNIKSHRPAIVVLFNYKKVGNHVRIDYVMRIIPSKKWDLLNQMGGEIGSIELSLVGVLSHETLHIWLGVHFGPEAAKALDKLPKPTNWEDYSAGVFGWGLK